MAALGVALEAAAASWTMFDAGAGTGQCGEQMRPLVNRLVGADLSAAMLAKAQERGVYDAVSGRGQRRSGGVSTLPS